MRDDELKALWRGQSLEVPPPLPGSAELEEMKSRLGGMNRTLSRRDWRENLAAVFVMVVFGAYYFFFTSTLSRLGSVIVILSSLFVIVYPWWRKRGIPKPAPDAPLMETLEAELRKVEVEIDLLRNVHWWYIGPGAVGVVLFLGGMAGSVVTMVVLLLLVLALDVFIYRLNQKACDKSLVPLQKELQSLLAVDGEAAAPEKTRRITMTKLILFLVAMSLAGGVGYWFGKRSHAERPAVLADPIAQKLENIRVKHRFPALAAAVVVNGEVVATNAVGFRKDGGTEAVTVKDRFHIGSVTKSMTATVAAMLVEQGKIEWETTVGETFGELGEELHPDYREATLEQLLSHRGGAPGNPPRLLWIKAWDEAGSPEEQRLRFVKGLLADEPEAKPGTKHIYSNQGYAIAGVMLEKATGKPWEELMRTMLFQPLGMTTAGFGAPGTEGEVDQPWGHTKELFRGLDPREPGPRADNPPAIGPAGTVHCSLPDLARYVVFHLKGEEEGSELLKAESFRKLHTAVGDDYALGWVVLERDWAGGRVLMHNGSNTMFYTVVWMAPEKKSAVIVATNVGVDAAFKGCDEAVGEMIREFFN